MFQKLIFGLFLSLSFAFSALAATDRANCFPFERLSPENRQYADELLLKALDTETLYTIVGGIKPMSSGFATFSTAASEPRDEKLRNERQASLAKMDTAREIFALWHCGDTNLHADLHHFARVFDGKRTTEAVVFDRRSTAKLVDERAAFFQRWGITPSAHPLQLLYAVEYADGPSRFAGYGYLFGYPDHAVRFFVNASVEEEITGKFVERDFYSIPTITSDTNRFVYATPKGHQEVEADRELRARASKVLAAYRTYRERFIGDGKPGVVAMMREWFCSTDDKCEIPRY